MGTIVALAVAMAWIKEHWILVACILIALILIVRRRSARRRQAMQAAYNAMLEQQQAAAKAAASSAAAAAPVPASSAEPSKPAKLQHIDPPEAQDGMCLVYFYPDVQFIMPPMYERTARSVPPLKKISLIADDETEDIYLSYEGETFGRMRENRLRKMIRDFDREGRGVLAASCGWTDTPMFSLAFYESLDSIREKWQNDEDYKEFTLTGNTNEEMQSNIACVEAGYSVSFEYDYEKEKHVASADGWPIGYCSAAAETYLEGHGDVEARILSITEKDSGKYSVRVMVVSE